MPGWLLKEGADEEDESGSEYDPAEELPELLKYFGWVVLINQLTS